MISSSFQHIILTRFNLQYEKGWTQHLQADWLEHRCSLFETYCLPSMQQQTNQDFVWLLLADIHTPEPYRTRLLAYSTMMPQIRVIFWASHYEDDYHELLHQLGEEYIGENQWLLSSRLDNDDMLEQTFVERIHQYANMHSLNDVIFTYPNGVQYFEREKLSFKIGYKQNHFLTFCEQKGTYIRTCFGVNHVLVPKQSLHTICTDDMWCEIVHSSNICNNYVPKYHYYWQHPQGQYPVALPRTAWHTRIPFLTCHWFAFRVAQARRFMHRLFAGCGHNA